MTTESAQLADLMRRVRALEIVREIEQLKYRYLRACDAKDAAAFRDCFVREGADLDYGVLGQFSDREPLVQIFEAVARSRGGDGSWLVHDIHHGHHPSVEVIDENTATARWTLGFVTLHVTPGLLTQASMEYEDRYVTEDGRWKIQRSYAKPLTSVTTAVPAGVMLGPGIKA
ncbi:MAG: bile acid 7-alpha dehydratase [Hydrocarboniphaga sp.]|uniref:nuclear transport factor 2 family protein n=1 Tax=Hydrocarboniphaga sp. TaxID=2033016 RepID=UPI002617A555|nr:nuclear transport factor 2 family protein [Hydrocarboniphaga sp.]MDB5970301.1 bile acid 7-alpha dehydratase [Hydrocarboniphaga sp.]